jgi:glucose-1-phosphate thymidylyltransferase
MTPSSTPPGPRRLVGLVPAAGKGSRLAPFPCAKELFPIGYQNYATANGTEQRPKVISQYLIENLTQAGADRILIILGDGKQDVARYYGDGHRFGIDIAYLYQEELSGMPGALDLAWPWIGDADVIFGMPDTIVEPRNAFADLVSDHRSHGADLTLGLFRTDNPSKFGMVECDASGRVVSTIDKPAVSSLTHMWGCACWSARFTALLHQYLIDHPYGSREIVLGDVFNAAIAEGMNVRGLAFEDGLYMDIGTSRELDSALRKFHL